MGENILKILVLEDSIDDIVMIERVLKKEHILFKTKCVDTKRELLLQIKDFKPNIILPDHSLPQFNSLEALKICLEIDSDITFILVTGTVSEEFAVECPRRGADDYILKSNLSRLPSTIQNAVDKRGFEVFRRKMEKTIKKKNKELTKINKELDSFVYSISHNLRSPLMSVLGLLHITKLEYQGKDMGLEVYLNKMEDSIHKLDETLKEIIDYSKNSHVTFDVSKVDIRFFFDKSFEKFQYIKGFDGVKKEILIRMFFRATEISDGSGLGLIVNESVEKLKGKINVSSQCEEGTYFKLIIPNLYRKYGRKPELRENTYSKENVTLVTNLQ